MNLVFVLGICAVSVTAKSFQVSFCFYFGLFLQGMLNRQLGGNLPVTFVLSVLALPAKRSRCVNVLLFGDLVLDLVVCFFPSVECFIFPYSSGENGWL